MWGRGSEGFATDPIMVENHLIFVTTRIQIRMDTYPQWCARQAGFACCWHAEPVRTRPLVSRCSPPVVCLASCFQARQEAPGNCSTLDAGMRRAASIQSAAPKPDLTWTPLGTPRQAVASTASFGGRHPVMPSCSSLPVMGDVSWCVSDTQGRPGDDRDLVPARRPHRLRAQLDPAGRKDGRAVRHGHQVRFVKGLWFLTI